MVGIIVTQHSLTTLPSLKGFNASASERAKWPQSNTHDFAWKTGACLILKYS